MATEVLEHALGQRVSYTWRTACEKVGVSGVSLYEGLKHSTATHLKALGADAACWPSWPAIVILARSRGAQSWNPE